MTSIYYELTEQIKINQGSVIRTKLWTGRQGTISQEDKNQMEFLVGGFMGLSDNIIDHANEEELNFNNSTHQNACQLCGISNDTMSEELEIKLDVLGIISDDITELFEELMKC